MAVSKKKQMSRGGGSTSFMDFEGQKLDIKSIMKDIEFVASPYMTWKEKKDLENKKIVALGGKAPKKQRLPLSVARVVMKKQKEREQKKTQENLILGKYGGSLGLGSSSKKPVEKRKGENKVLRSTEGSFRQGVLNVKLLLKTPGPRSSSAPKESSSNAFFSTESKKKKGGNKNKGKKKGGGRKRH